MVDDHRAAAVAALAERDYPAAGDAYTRAGWARLADPREGRSPFDADERGWVGRGLQWLVCAALAYRVAGLDERATRRGVEGVAVARDLENALAAPGQRACLREFVADFRVAGRLDGAGEAYGDAEAAYADAAADVSDAQTLATTTLFEAAADPLKQVARGLDDGEIAVSWADLHGPDPDDPGRFLGHRAAFKRQRFPSLVARALEAGHLAAPRGTTAYDNAGFRCPNCEATDVNWTGESTLCLRCSTPMVER
ncbi:hypothetical protein [Haloarcula litorea]|uniref:hypothetical protein n=1 Tax=Haloarcula litorea TaxID=3032579 RepID=UPI0023E8CE6A|nr:hypothetical protein [Halomicroarcula sp. GDY20]